MRSRNLGISWRSPAPQPPVHSKDDLSSTKPWTPNHHEHTFPHPRWTLLFWQNSPDTFAPALHLLRTRRQQPWPRPRRRRRRRPTPRPTPSPRPEETHGGQASTVYQTQAALSTAASHHPRQHRSEAEISRCGKSTGRDVQD